MSRFKHEANRLLRIEAGAVSGDRGATGYPVTSGARDYPREGVQSAFGGDLNYGDRLVMFSGGDNDYPVSIGFNPWVL